MKRLYLRAYNSKHNLGVLVNVFIYQIILHIHTQTERHTNKNTQKAGCGKRADQISWKKVHINKISHSYKFKFVVISF